jgi:hypothetical protein
MDKPCQTWVEVNFIVGGGMQAYAMASRADVIVLVDSQEEVVGVPDAPRLIKMPLGGEDTALSSANGRRPLCHRGFFR